MAADAPGAEAAGMAGLQRGDARGKIGRFSWVRGSGGEAQVGSPSLAIVPDGGQGGAAHTAERAAHLDAGEDRAVGVDGERAAADGTKKGAGGRTGRFDSSVNGWVNDWVNGGMDSAEGRGELCGGHALRKGGAALVRRGSDAGGDQ